ncbi:MAG: hypothetical protein U0Q12_07040 [Vicinamibacterales bacterium]
MDVFLVPLGSSTYELYCEIDPDEPVTRADEAAPGWFSKLEDKFAQTMHVVTKRGPDPAPDASLWVRLRARSLAWLSERVAEQRLLWHLRWHRNARLVFPDDLTADEAHRIVQRHLSSDMRRHWAWLAVNAVLLVASSVLTVIPGPNVVALYFSFRVVGHYLSIRGAKQGLSGTAWTAEASAPLADLRRAIALEPGLREARVSDVATRLELRHLATFVQRMAFRSA